MSGSQNGFQLICQNGTVPFRKLGVSHFNKKKIELQSVPPPMPWSHYQLGFQGSIVPQMALAEAQVVILYFFSR